MEAAAAVRAAAVRAAAGAVLPRSLGRRASVANCVAWDGAVQSLLSGDYDGAVDLVRDKFVGDLHLKKRFIDDLTMWAVVQLHAGELFASEEELVRTLHEAVFPAASLCPTCCRGGQKGHPRGLAKLHDLAAKAVADCQALTLQYGDAIGKLSPSNRTCAKMCLRYVEGVGPQHDDLLPLTSDELSALGAILRHKSGLAGKQAGQLHGAVCGLQAGVRSAGETARARAVAVALEAPDAEPSVNGDVRVLCAGRVLHTAVCGLQAGVRSAGEAARARAVALAVALEAPDAEPSVNGDVLGVLCAGRALHTAVCGLQAGVRSAGETATAHALAVALEAPNAEPSVNGDVLGVLCAGQGLHTAVCGLQAGVRSAGETATARALALEWAEAAISRDMDMAGASAEGRTMILSCGFVHSCLVTLGTMNTRTMNGAELVCAVENDRPAHAPFPRLGEAVLGVGASKALMEALTAAHRRARQHASASGHALATPPHTDLAAEVARAGPVRQSAALMASATAALELPVYARQVVTLSAQLAGVRLVSSRLAVEGLEQMHRRVADLRVGMAGRVHSACTAVQEAVDVQCATAQYGLGLERPRAQPDAVLELPGAVLGPDVCRALRALDSEVEEVSVARAGAERAARKAYALDCDRVDAYRELRTLARLSDIECTPEMPTWQLLGLVLDKVERGAARCIDELLQGGGEGGREKAMRIQAATGFTVMRLMASIGNDGSHQQGSLEYFLGEGRQHTRAGCFPRRLLEALTWDDHKDLLASKGFTYADMASAKAADRQLRETLLGGKNSLLARARQQFLESGLARQIVLIYEGLSPSLSTWQDAGAGAGVKLHDKAVATARWALVHLRLLVEREGVDCALRRRFIEMATEDRCSRKCDMCGDAPHLRAMKIDDGEGGSVAILARTDKAAPEICGRCFSGSYCAECMAMHKGTVACMEALKGFKNGNELVRMHEDDEAREEASREARQRCSAGYKQAAGSSARGNGIQHGPASVLLPNVQQMVDAAVASAPQLDILCVVTHEFIAENTRTVLSVVNGHKGAVVGAHTRAHSPGKQGKQCGVAEVLSGDELSQLMGELVLPMKPAMHNAIGKGFDIVGRVHRAISMTMPTVCALRDHGDDPLVRRIEFYSTAFAYTHKVAWSEVLTKRADKNALFEHAIGMPVDTWVAGYCETSWDPNVDWYMDKIVGAEHAHGVQSYLVKWLFFPDEREHLTVFTETALLRLQCGAGMLERYRSRAGGGDADSISSHGTDKEEDDLDGDRADEGGSEIESEADSSSSKAVTPPRRPDGKGGGEGGLGYTPNRLGPMNKKQRP